MRIQLNQMLTQKYFETENILETIKEDFNVLKEKTTKNQLQGIYHPKPENFLFDKMYGFIQKENALLYFSTATGDTFISNQHIDSYLLEAFEQLYLKHLKLNHFFQSKVKSIYLTLDQYSLNSMILNKRQQYIESIYENNLITLYCSKLNYSSKRKFLIEKTIQKRIADCLANQCSIKPFLTEDLKIKIFNKIISAILKDILFPANNLEKLAFRGPEGSLLNKRISTKRICSLFLDKDEILASYVVPAFFSAVKFRKVDFDDFLVFFDRHLTPRILLEISLLKEEHKTAFSLKSINSLMVKYGLCKFSFYDTCLSKEFVNELIDDLKEVDYELAKFFKREKEANSFLGNEIEDCVPF